MFCTIVLVTTTVTIETTLYSSLGTSQANTESSVGTSFTSASTPRTILIERYNPDNCSNSWQLPGTDGKCRPIDDIRVRRIKILLSFLPVCYYFYRKRQLMKLATTLKETQLVWLVLLLHTTHRLHVRIQCRRMTF